MPRYIANNSYGSSHYFTSSYHFRIWPTLKTAKSHLLKGIISSPGGPTYGRVSLANVSIEEYTLVKKEVHVGQEIYRIDQAKKDTIAKQKQDKAKAKIERINKKKEALARKKLREEKKLAKLPPSLKADKKVTITL